MGDILDGKVADIKKKLKGVPEDQLSGLKRREAEGKGRKGVLDAIDRRIAEAQGEAPGGAPQAGGGLDEGGSGAQDGSPGADEGPEAPGGGGGEGEGPPLPSHLRRAPDGSVVQVATIRTA